MKYKINDQGLYYINRSNSKRWLWLTLFNIGIIVFNLFFIIKNLSLSELSIIIAVWGAASFYVSIYWPLIHKGKLSNSLIMEIDIRDKEFSLITPKTILYPSIVCHGKLVDLINENIINTTHFPEFSEKIVIRYRGKDFYLIKDFFQDFESIEKLFHSSNL